jgi:hypothetical protein
MVGHSLFTARDVGKCFYPRPPVPRRRINPDAAVKKSGDLERDFHRHQRGHHLLTSVGQTDEEGISARSVCRVARLTHGKEYDHENEKNV